METDTFAPAKAPAYILQYYDAHLEQIRETAETLLTLVCQGWSKAWEALKGSYAGFLNDAKQAWKSAEDENEEAIAKGEAAPHIGDEIRCALVRTSINSLAPNLPGELIVQLVKRQKLTFRHGFVYAQQFPDSVRRDNALLSLITGLATGDDMRVRALVEAVSVALAIEGSGRRALA